MGKVALDTAVSFVKDILFPVYCVACNAEGEWWCEECRSKRSIGLILRCPACDKPTARGEACASCSVTSYLNGATSVSVYQENSPLGKLIRQCKYAYAKDIARVWDDILRGVAPQFGNQIPPQAVIIPVPLHQRRERERGFNQAELLATIFSKVLGNTLLSQALVRTRYTNQQAKLARPERFKNIADAFTYKNTTPAPAEVVLVDDVFTTGATLEECAKVLKANGSRWVWGLTLARD